MNMYEYESNGFNVAGSGFDDGWMEEKELENSIYSRGPFNSVLLPFSLLFSDPDPSPPHQ